MEKSTRLLTLLLLACTQAACYQLTSSTSPDSFSDVSGPVYETTLASIPLWPFTLTCTEWTVSGWIHVVYVSDDSMGIFCIWGGTDFLFQASFETDGFTVRTPTGLVQKQAELPKGVWFHLIIGSTELEQFGVVSMKNGVQYCLVEKISTAIIGAAVFMAAYASTFTVRLT